MEITFLGATREVTGSLHMLTTTKDRILLDCGMFQGRRKESDKKNRSPFPNPEKITNTVISHAHIDHSGRIPLLTKSNYHGRVFCTRPTADALSYMLLDSAHIQESDALYLNYKSLRGFLSQMKSKQGKKEITNREMGEIKRLLKKNRHELRANEIQSLIRKNKLKEVLPLYTKDDAENALEQLEGRPYKKPITIGDNMTCTFYEAGHILGSAVCIIKSIENGQKRTVCYTGDLGRFNKPIIKDPTLDFAPEDQDIDLLVMETTYGDRLHEPVKDMKHALKKVLTDTFARRGCVLIPSFAFGRTQEVLYVLHELYQEGAVFKAPVFVDSPLASRLTTVFGEHPEVYDQETHETFLQHGKNPFEFEEMNFTRNLEESMELLNRRDPHIVISASGMCEAGRILHHLRYKIHNPKNTIITVGYMAENTLGRRLQDLGTEYENSSRRGRPPMIRLLNKEYPLAAQVKELGGFSAHGDKEELFRFVSESNLRIKKIALVHGEEHQTLSFAEFLKEKGYEAHAPMPGETIPV